MLGKQVFLLEWVQELVLVRLIESARGRVGELEWVLVGLEWVGEL